VEIGEVSRLFNVDDDGGSGVSDTGCGDWGFAGFLVAK